MTKFETILKLSEIKGRMKNIEASVAWFRIMEDIEDLIFNLSQELQSDDDCPGCGCPSHDRCHGCGHFHD